MMFWGIDIVAYYSRVIENLVVNLADCEIYFDQIAGAVFFFSSRRRHTILQGDWSSDVCSSDLDHERPEDQRQHPQHIARRDRDAVRPVERVPNRVQRARADVAVYHTQRRERERDEIAALRLLGNDGLRRGGHGREY